MRAWGSARFDSRRVTRPGAQAPALQPGLPGSVNFKVEGHRANAQWQPVGESQMRAGMLTGRPTRLSPSRRSSLSLMP